MAKQDDTIPVEHGLGSATAITAGEAGKGLLGCIVGGGWRGALIGGLVVGGLVAGATLLLTAGLGFVGLGAVSTGAAAVLGAIGAVAGAIGGAGFGAPAGAVIGAGRGVGKGIDRIGRDSAAAQMLRTQEMTAQAQAETAQAMQGRIMERMMTPPSAPEPVVMPATASPANSACNSATG